MFDTMTLKPKSRIRLSNKRFTHLRTSLYNNDYVINTIILN